MDAKREFTPMKANWANPDTIKCKDCKYRDKTEIKIGDTIKKFGVTKCFCEKYIGVHAGGNDKPSDILFQNADCDFYEKGD